MKHDIRMGWNIDNLILFYGFFSYCQFLPDYQRVPRKTFKKNV